MTAVALQSFGFGEQLVRVVDREGAAWFVGNDVCAALELVNPRDAIGRLDEDEKGVVTTDTPGGQQQITIISESGVYTLTFTSRKAAAKQFKRWVTHEVLPTLRTTGRYALTPETPTFRPPETPEEFEKIKLGLAVANAARLGFGPRAFRRAWRMWGLPEVGGEEEAQAALAGVAANVPPSVVAWLEQRTVNVPGARLRSGDAHADYAAWAARDGYGAGEVLGFLSFSKALSRCGVPSMKSNGCWRVGLQLRS